MSGDGDGGGGGSAAPGAGAAGSAGGPAAAVAVAAFGILDLRVGRVVRAEVNAEARKPSLKVWIDLGPLGEKTSSAQLRDLYRPEDLVGRLVIAAVNLGERRIAGFRSEVLILGVPDAEGRVVLLQPERDAPPGGRVY